MKPALPLVVQRPCGDSETSRIKHFERGRKNENLKIQIGTAPYRTVLFVWREIFHKLFTRKSGGQTAFFTVVIL